VAAVKLYWFTKAKRAQNVEDYESWVAGGVVPTLNAMDNNGEAFATVLILMESGKPVVMRNREGCAGGGKGLMYSDKSFTLATSNDQFLIIDGTRVDDVRVYEDGIVPTVISRYGTGGGNVPMVFPIDDAREIEKHQNGTGIGDENAPAYTLDRQQVPGVVNESVVRRLTPMECERLQGFPDNWTDGQADSNRYKQMGNAVAVPVVSWIVNQMVAE
jgi:site-specific DNA-cytosine methylase